MPPSLRAVGSDEQPAKTVVPKTVAEAAKKGTPRELLVAMRDRIAETVSKADCPPRELAALTKRIQDIVKDIEALDAREDDGNRVRELETALRDLAPNHPLIASVASDSYDPASI